MASRRSPSPMRRASYSSGPSRSSGSGTEDLSLPSSARGSYQLPRPSPVGAGSMNDLSAYSLTGATVRGGPGYQRGRGTSFSSGSGSSGDSSYRPSPGPPPSLQRTPSTGGSARSSAGYGSRPTSVAGPGSYIPSSASTSPRMSLPPISSLASFPSVPNANSSTSATNRMSTLNLRTSGYVPTGNAPPPTSYSAAPGYRGSAAPLQRRSSIGSRPSAADLSSYPSAAGLRESRSMMPGAGSRDSSGDCVMSSVSSASLRRSSSRGPAPRSGGYGAPAPPQTMSSSSGYGAPPQASARDDLDLSINSANPTASAGEGPFVCEVPGCGRRFTRSYNLKAHQATHLNDKKHQCEYCAQSFARRHDKERHERMHTGEKPYICDQCQKGFMRSDALSRHRLLEPNCAQQRR